MTVQNRYLQAIVIALALALLLAIAPDRGIFPSTSDMIALQRIRAAGADLEEWRWLARFISLYPHNGRVWEQMAVLDYRNGLCHQAVVEFNLANHYGKVSDDSLIPYGSCLMEEGKSLETVELLSSHTGDATKPAGLELLLARAHLKQGDYGHALLVLGAWAAGEKKNPQATYFHGLYQALTDPDEALKTLQNAARMDPSYDQSYREIQTAVNTAWLSTDKAYQAVVIGRTYGNLNEWDLAEYAFLVSTESNPNYAEAHAWLGEARQHLGEDGSDELSLALELDPTSIITQALNALHLQRQGKPEQALIYLNQIAKTEPDNPAWQMALGQANVQLGQLPEAFEYYQQAVELEPSNTSTWQALAEFCFNNQYAVQAAGIPAAYKAVLMAPESSRSLDLAGQAALTGGNLSSAESYLRKAIELDPRYAPAHFHLALVLLQRENNLEARQELEKAATLGSREAEKLLAQISP